MSVYWMTYRLADDATKRPTYEERYKALIDAIDRRASRWWIEPTSFMLFESAHDINALASACKAAINPAWDLVLIRLLDTKNAVVVGKVEDQNLFILMPYVKKL